MPLIMTAEFQPSGYECARCTSGFEFDELSEITGIDARRLSRFETGRDYPTKQEIKLLADVFGVLPKFFNNAWAKLPDHAYNFRKFND